MLRYSYLLGVFLLVSCSSIIRAQSHSVDIAVSARQFEFQPKVITVHKGDHVKLTLTSEDVDHGFAIDELKINKRIKPGAPTVLEFDAAREGRFRFYCSVNCGDDHDKMAGELVVNGGGSSSPADMNVDFVKDQPGVVIVESNGQRIRIDTRTNTVARLEAQPSQSPPPGIPRGEIARAETAKGSVSKTEAEPYDYHLVNLPTPKRVPRRSLNLIFTHRFTEEITPAEGEKGDMHRARIANNLFGLDSFSVSSFGFTYGITDRLYAMAYRSPIVSTGTNKTIEMGFGYHLLDEAGRSPVALSVQATVEGENNFTERYTENLQAMVERSVTRYVHLFFSPAVSLNSNGQGRFNPRPNQFFPPAAVASTFRLGQNTGSFGFGMDARIRPSVSLLFEFTPRVGFTPGNVVPIFDPKTFQVLGFKNDSEPEIGFGIQKRIGRHIFTLTFSNTQYTTTSKYNSSNLFLSPRHFTVGFNLFRRLHG